MFRLARDNLGRRPSDWKGQQDSVPRKFALHLRSTVGLSEDLGEKKNHQTIRCLICVDLHFHSFLQCQDEELDEDEEVMEEGTVVASVGALPTPASCAS